MKKVIAYKNLPARLPILSAAVMWLLLDRFNAPGWLHGGAWVLMALLWAGEIVRFIEQKEADLFKDEK